MNKANSSTCQCGSKCAQPNDSGRQDIVGAAPGCACGSACQCGDSCNCAR